MNTKAANVAVGTNFGDIAKYILAVLIAAGGVAVFYLMPQWPTPVRALLVALGFAAALGVMALTGIGHRGRDFVSESMFELRKVVWPTRQEAVRITGVVLLVVAVISLILAGFDFLISWLIKLLLSN
jgi:preprotein translocase subunit SecE